MDWLKTENIERILLESYGIIGEISPLPGELDFNFKIKSGKEKYILKISRPESDEAPLRFQQEILSFLQTKEVNAPHFIPTKNGEMQTRWRVAENQFVQVRMLSWLEGKVWAKINFHSHELLNSLGEAAGKMTAHLEKFNTNYAHRKLDWDINQTFWTKDFQNRFSGEEKDLITYFYNGFVRIWPVLDRCRKSVVHNDANDYNVLVSDDYAKVNAIIDYGDAVFTSTINDLAIAITYAVMGKVDPLEAATYVVGGYHHCYPLKEEELEILYWLVGARLVISLTKSLINKEKEPDNRYLLISEKPAWDLIKKWRKTNSQKAAAFFRTAAGFPAHRDANRLAAFLAKHQTTILNLIELKEVQPISLDITANTITDFSLFKEPEKLAKKLHELWEEGGERPLVGGYDEVRPELLTDEFKVETNEGAFWESVLLGIQVWHFQEFSVRSLFPGIVLGLKTDALYVMHKVDGVTFYSIYRNLIPASHLHIGSEVSWRVGTVRSEDRPFSYQLTLWNPLEVEPKESCAFQDRKVYSALYPSPGLLFSELKTMEREENNKIVGYRKMHLGKSLSISYDDPLQIVRGDGMYLIDQTGRKYLDMVNNVAHVGHEHPAVVQAGQQQMALLNTNSRYLHDEIIEFAQNLLSTFPPELSVVSFVNSGSEANELAMRMAKTYTHQKDFIAVQMAYHGNSNACIDISSYKFDGKGGEGAPEHTHVVPLPDTFRGLYTGTDAAKRYAKHVQLEIEKLQKLGRKPAAFISENIISTGGQIELPDGYLEQVYQYVHAVGGLCIADEIQIGCGRMGKTFWGFQLHDVQPDIVTIGKPIGNGHPLAAVVCTQEVADAFNNGMEYFNTFGGNPVSCAIGNEVLNVIKREHLQENAWKTGEYTKNELKALRKEFPIIADVRGQGLFLGFELCDANKKPLTTQAAYLTDRMKTLGILLSPDGPDHNVMKLKPPIIFNQKDADEFLNKLKLVLKEDRMQI